MKSSNPVITGIRIIFALTCMGALIGGVWTSLTEHAFTGTYFLTALTAFVSLIITHAPDFITYRDSIMMPAAFQTGFSLFTFCAMFLGEIMNFYELFSWWDTMLHFTSGVIFSIVGLMLFTSLNRRKEARSQLNPATVLIFSICFSIACGAAWEIFEFAGDTFWGMNMQRWQTGISQEEWSALQNMSNLSNPGLINTMKDIIADSFGSLLSIVFILPIARYGCKYQKTQVPTKELLKEWQEAHAAMQRPMLRARTAAARALAVTRSQDAAAKPASLRLAEHMQAAQQDIKTGGYDIA